MPLEELIRDWPIFHILCLNLIILLKGSLIHSYALSISLHLVDGFDEIKKGLGTFGFVRYFASSSIGWVENGVVLQIFEDGAIDIEFLSSVHVEPVKERN